MPVAPLLGAPPGAAALPTRAQGAAVARWGWPAAMLLLALLAGLALRLHALGRMPFWVDEAATLGIAALPWRDFLEHVFWVEANPPAYYALMSLWQRLAPADAAEAWLRLPSALAGVAALLPFWLFCRRAFGDRAAACGVLLLALAAPHIRFSQEARNYALLFLAFTLALLAAQALVRAEAGRRWPAALALGLLTGVMIWLHATGLVTGATVYVYAFTVLLARRAVGPATLLPLLAAGIGGLLLALPWVLVVLDLATSSHSVMSWQPPLTLDHAGFALGQVLLAPYLGRLAPAAILLHLAAFGFAVARCWRHPDFLGGAAALGFALLALLGISLKAPVLFERTALFTLALWLALLAAGLGTLRRPLVLALALLLLGVQARALHSHYRFGHAGEPWDEVAAELARRAAPGDLVLPIGIFEAVATRHYLGAAGAGLRLAILPLGYEEPFMPMGRAMLHPEGIWQHPGPAELCAAAAGAQSVWILGRAVVLDSHLPMLAEPLQAAGARPLPPQAFDSLVLAPWSAPRCPPATAP